MNTFILMTDICPIIYFVYYNNFYNFYVLLGIILSRICSLLFHCKLCGIWIDYFGISTISLSSIHIYKNNVTMQIIIFVFAIMSNIYSHKFLIPLAILGNLKPFLDGYIYGVIYFSIEYIFYLQNTYYTHCIWHIFSALCQA